jgi:hypothetical protein
MLAGPKAGQVVIHAVKQCLCREQQDEQVRIKELAKALMEKTMISTRLENNQTSETFWTGNGRL